MSPFRDVPATMSFSKSVSEAYERGLVNGIGNGLFAPDNTLTMAESLTILIRALGLKTWARAKRGYGIPRQRRHPLLRKECRLCGLQDRACARGHNRTAESNQSLTKSRAAALLNRFIDYMREDMAKRLQGKSFAILPFVVK